jgi:hypothetical protein
MRSVDRHRRDLRESPFGEAASRSGARRIPVRDAEITTWMTSTWL